MDKKFLQACIDQEVDHWAIKGKVSLIHKMWFRHFRPESNAVYLIRKYQYYCSKGTRVAHVMEQLYSVLLMRRYSIYMAEKCEIGLGFKIWHPYGIVVNNVKIGKNFNIQHNCTIGRKTLGIGTPGTCPEIGDNVCMYAHSLILGPVRIGDNVTIGANSLVNKDLLEAGVYVGTPAHKVK